MKKEMILLWIASPMYENSMYSTDFMCGKYLQMVANNLSVYFWLDWKTNIIIIINKYSNYSFKITSWNFLQGRQRFWVEIIAELLFFTLLLSQLNAIKIIVMIHGSQIFFYLAESTNNPVKAKDFHRHTSDHTDIM